MKQKKPRKRITSPADLQLTGRYGGPNPARWWWEQLNQNGRHLTVKEATDEFDWKAWANGKPIPDDYHRYNTMGRAIKRVEDLGIKSGYSIKGRYSPGGRGKVWSHPHSGSVNDTKELVDAVDDVSKTIDKGEEKRTVFAKHALENFDKLPPDQIPDELKAKIPEVRLIDTIKEAGKRALKEFRKLQELPPGEQPPEEQKE